MYFEDFLEGNKFETRSRVVTGTDIDIFAALTGATNPLFMDEEFGKKLGYKGRVAAGLLTLSLAQGLQYSIGLFDHIIAFSGIDKLRFLAPVNPGDTIRCSVEVLERRGTKKEDRGIVTTHWNCHNQEGQLVLELLATFLVRKRG